MTRRTGAGTRINPDHVSMHIVTVIGVVIVFTAALLTSWQGLVWVAAQQQLAPEWRWITPIMIDVPIVVMTVAGIVFRQRRDTTWLVNAGAVLLTAISSAANFLHTVSIAGLGTFEAWIGATINALAPWLVLLTTEVLGALITRPRREDREARRKERGKAKAARAARRRQRQARAAIA